MKIINRIGQGVLMVDDEENFLLTAGVLLKSAGIEQVWTISDSRQVMTFLEKRAPAVIVLDLTMPHITGRELLTELTREYPGIPVIILTAHDDLTMAVECMKEGARDYLVKPVEESRFISSISGALEVVQLKEEMHSLKESFLHGASGDDNAFDAIITDSSLMRSIFTYVRAIAPSEHPVLICGETGVGKELIAKAVHELSGRSGDFVAVNVAGLDDTVFSDTLFGHEKGAFTGAERARDGLVRKAREGTLFLDEIGDLAESIQIKLLRLLQERQYYPMGSDLSRPSRARIVVATNRDIHDLVRKGRFRKDLYYRLRAHEVRIPPLRDRLEDLLPLVDFFLEKAAGDLGKKVPAYPGELIVLLRNYHFPGNIRELEGMLNDALARHGSGVLTLESFRKAINEERLGPMGHEPSEPDQADIPSKDRFSYRGPFPTIREVEEYLLDEAMTRAEDNQTIAADLLGITRQTLNKRLTRSRRKS